MSTPGGQISTLSTLSTHSTDSTLTPVQAQVVAALAQGATVTAAAAAAGLHRSTIHHWLKTLPDFSNALRQARKDYQAVLVDELKELSARALATLRGLLEDPGTPACIRLKTALAILQRPVFPNPGWSLPEPVATDRERAALDTLALLEADYRLMRSGKP